MGGSWVWVFGQILEKRSPVFALLTQGGLGDRTGPTTPPLHRGSRARDARGVESAWLPGCEHNTRRGSRRAPGVWSPHGSRGVNTPRAEVAGGHAGSHRGSRGWSPPTFPLNLVQKRQERVWGSQNTQKRRTRMKKCGLGDLGAPKCSKALKTQLCDSDPSEHEKTSYTYAKTQK